MASPAPALVINEAKWCATKGGMDITVTDVCAKLVAERGAGKYLYLHNSENKAALFGNPWPKVTKELWIRYTYLGEPKTETFHETQEIFLGDVEACFQSQSDNYGYIEDSVADALLFRFRPILKLHPSETSYPARVDWYLPQTALYLDFNGGQYCVLDKINNPADVIRSYSTANYNFHTREKRRFFFKHLNTESVRYGEGPNKLPQVPYYCTCNATEDGDICLTYFFFYAYNGPIMENPLVPAKIRQIAGTHQGDWEYVAIRVSPDGQDIRAVHMSRHTGAEGKWYLAACPEASRDAGWHIDPVKGRVVVYPGCESHANYNVPGRQDRGHGGFVDDKCGDGAVWDPEYVVNLGSIGRPRTPWTRFGGLWGKLQEAKLEGGGPEGPVLKSSFFGRTYPMKPDNCIPVFGSWWTEMKTQSDARINAAGRSLIKKGSKPAVSPFPMVPSALTDDHADFESGAYAAIPVPGSAAPAGDIDVGRGFPPGPAPPSAPVAPGASPMQHWSSESLIGARSFGPGGPGGITAPPTYAPPAPQAKRTDMLESSGEVAETSLSHDTHLVSPNGEYHLWMQSDGNVVLYQRANGGSPVWSSRTKGLGMAPYTLVCQGDGNVVVYDGNRRPTWKTDTYDKNPKGPYRFIVQNDRNIVLLDRINKVVWAAGSDQSKPSEFGKTLM